MAVVYDAQSAVILDAQGDPVTWYGAPDYITAPSFANPRVGSLITPTAATWYDGTLVGYSWESADDDSGTNAAEVATTATYTPDVADEGLYLRFTETRIRDSAETDASTAWIGPISAASSGHPSYLPWQPAWSLPYRLPHRLHHA